MHVIDVDPGSMILVAIYIILAAALLAFVAIGLNRRKKPPKIP
jgi:hypothetical protein